MNIIKKYMGIFEALLSASLFGLIPFFFIPLYQLGFSTESHLVFRFLFASLIMIVITMIQKKKLCISLHNFFSIAIVSLTYFVAALFLFSALTYMPSGIVTTIFFINPLFVMMLTIIFLKEKLETYKIIFSLTTCAGVALLSGFFNTVSEVNLIGISLSLLSGFGYALYILGLYKIQIDNLCKEVISLYLFIICTVLASVYAYATDTLMAPSTGFEWLLLFATGLITAVLANVFLMSAIAKIGSVLSSILGAMEPITAVVIGIIVFNEHLNFHVVFGILIVIISVVLLTIIPMLRSRQQ